jgi:hypothetical protein
MIKPNELRIGNWVNNPLGKGRSEPGLAKVKTLGYGGINEWQDMGASGNIPYEDLKPILITTELLERFGFAEVNSYNPKERHFKKDGFTQLADYGAQLIILPEGGYAYLSCGYYENTIDCGYLHQLQNLYFALTGEELTIKETV